MSNIRLIIECEMVCGLRFLVDVSDIRVANYKWHLKNGYAFNKRLGYLHRYLMGNNPDKSLTIDHINRNRLDNRRCNLRWATSSVQNYNKKTRLGQSGHRGILLRGDKFVIKITKGYVSILKTANTLDEAIDIRKKLEHELYGECVSDIYVDNNNTNNTDNTDNTNNL